MKSVDKYVYPFDFCRDFKLRYLAKMKICDIATNGFVKKTQKIPAKELKLAKERRADWLSRHKEG